jgi:hypothetical protein
VDKRQLNRRISIVVWLRSTESVQSVQRSAARHLPNLISDKVHLASYSFDGSHMRGTVS